MPRKPLDYSAFKDFPEDGAKRGFKQILKDIFLAPKYNAVAYKKFAKSNGFIYNSLEKKITEEGTLFNQGNYKQITNTLEGELDGLPFKSGTLFYKDTERFGGPSRSVFFIRVSFMRYLPHLVMDSIVEYGEKGHSTLPIVFDKSQRLELEGDFNKYFNVYSYDKYAITTLSILAPDIMEFLIKKKAFCDIEIIKNHIYIYWAHLAPTKDNHKKYFELARGLLDEIGHKLVRSDVFADRYQKDAHLSAKNVAEPVILNNKILRISGSLFSTLYTTIVFSYIFRNFLVDKTLFGYPLDDAKRYEDQFLIFIIVFGVFYLMYLYYRFTKSAKLEDSIEHRYSGSFDEASKKLSELEKIDYVQESSKSLDDIDKEYNVAHKELSKLQQVEYKKADRQIKKLRGEEIKELEKFDDSLK